MFRLRKQVSRDEVDFGCWEDQAVKQSAFLGVSSSNHMSGSASGRCHDYVLAQSHRRDVLFLQKNGG